MLDNILAQTGTGLDLWPLIVQGGVPFLLFAALMAVMAKRIAPWWVVEDKNKEIEELKQEIKELKQDRDGWMAVALEGTRTAATVTEELKERRTRRTGT